MKVQLEQVRQKPFRWDERRQIAPERLERSEVLGLGEIAWRGEIAFAAPGFRLQATVAYDQTLQCTRCLQPITEVARAELDLMIFIDQAEVSPGDHELEASDLGVLFVDEAIVDLDPLLIEQLQLNVPMRVVCREDCAGLCPVCGADRNDTPCDCEKSAVDPRLADLAALKDRLDS